LLWLPYFKPPSLIFGVGREPTVEGET